MAIDGTYKTIVDFPIGKKEGTFVLTTEGDVGKGTVTLMGSTVDIRNGKASGNSFEFVFGAPTPMGKMKVNANGTVEGDKISGIFKLMIAKMAFEGTRVG